MISRPITSPVEAYAAGVRGWACEVPIVNVHVVSDSSGPIERAMETLPALAVERLSIPEAYRIARALRFVGFILDQEQQRIEIGERAHRLLRERSQMQANADRPYSAEHVADDFLDAYGRRLSKDAGWLRDRILTYVDTKVAFRRADENVADLGAGAVAARRRAIDGYSHPTVETLTNTLVPVVPAFHVSGPLYNDLERSSWTMMPKHVVKTGLAFTIVVDGEHWVPLSGDQQTLARTEYLLVDARTPTCIVCERVWFRERTTNQEAVQTMGLEWDTQTFEKRPLVADASYALTGRIASRWDFPLHEQDRMLHVVLGIMALLSHRKVMMKKTESHSGRGDVIRIELPRVYAVDKIVDDINHRRHMR